MGQLTAAAFTAYDPSNAGSIDAGPLALYSVSLDQINPTQLNEGFTEVGTKTAGFDLENGAELQAALLTDIEPVVIGPNGKLYLLDGHHTFTALADSIYGASDPTVYVNVVANYSNLTESEFFATMQQNNLLLPLNDGVPETVNDATGAPIPTALTALTNDPYRGLEYSILKNKSSKLFTSGSNITGNTGASAPGLDKMTGFYADFLEAAAYRDADSGLGLPYLSPGDIAFSTQWNLSATSATTLQNVTGTVDAGQLPGFILTGNITITGTISNTTLANGALDGTKTGSFDESTTFASFNGITELNAGTMANPIVIGTPNVGFVLQLGADKGFTVTLSGTTNTYTGGTSLLAGTLIIASDGSLGQAATSYTYNQTTVRTDIQAANGIVFDSLDEGNATLQLGTSAGGGTTPFTLSRPIAVGGEAATLNLNGYLVTLNGALVSLGVDGDGIGNASGFSDFIIDDNSSNKGVLTLATPSPDFFGNLIIGNVNKPTVRVMSDAAMGNTTGPAGEIGQIELNGGTFQAGASFSSVRSLFLGGGSTYDVDGFNSSFSGSLTDIQRALTITNSSATAGAVTFGSFIIGATATLSFSSSNAESVTFTNGITRSGNATLIIAPKSGVTLGSTEQVFATAAPTVLHGIVAPWMITDNGASAGSNPYDFLNYDNTKGFIKATYSKTGTGTSAGIAVSTSSDVVEETSGTTSLSGDAAVYALKVDSGATIAVATGHTLTIGDGTVADAAGLILSNGTISGGTLAFGASEAVISAKGGSVAIGSTVTGTGGLTLDGSGTVAVSTAWNLSGAVNIDSGTLSVTAANFLIGDAAGVTLGDVKSSPSNAVLNLAANQTFSTLNSVGNNSAITISNSATLTIGDTTNNLSSILSSSITETGAVTPGALTIGGSGLVDLTGISSGKLSLVAGSTIVVDNTAQLRVGAGEFANATFGINLNGAGTQLQFAQGGGAQFANAITGTGELHLIGGILELTGINNTYSGGTVIETGSTLDITTALGDLPTNNENITNAGGLVVFDQSVSGTFTGIISDGQEMGTGPMLSGSLDKDDSSNDNASGSNVNISKAQTYTGATNIEAGTLTLDAVDTLADSSGVTLGRVGGAVDSQTAGLALGADNTVKFLSSNASNTTSVQLNGHVLTLTPGTGVTASFAGAIGDGATAGGQLVKDGAGTESLSGTNTFTGALTLNGGVLELASTGAASTGAVTFGGGTSGTLQIDNTALTANHFANTLANFAANQTIDLAGLHFVSGSTTAMLSGNTLTVTDGGATDTLTMSGLAANTLFATSDDGNGGTDLGIACYCRGTLILTPGGEVPVETLAIGDLLMTHSGAARPIRWIGHRAYDGRFIAGNREVLPICVQAGALFHGVPARDLWLSPEHSLFIDDVLVQAKHLINGVTVVQPSEIEAVEYFHIELESHDVIYADGAPAETFVDCDNRMMFANGAEYAQLYPNDERPRWQFSAPRLEWGTPALTGLRAALFQRAVKLGAEKRGQVPIPGADLRLVVGDTTLVPIATHGTMHRFAAPTGSGPFWLSSAAIVPAERISSSLDQRRLGVAIERLVLSNQDLTIEVWHGHPALRDGFHDDEAMHRWTDGHARIPEELLRPFAGALTIDVHLASQDIAAAAA